MSAAQPGELREALAEALRTVGIAFVDTPTARAYADAILPIAERLARERAAEELTSTAKFLWSRGFDLSGGLVAARAADLIAPMVAVALTADDQPVQP